MTPNRGLLATAVFASTVLTGPAWAVPIGDLAVSTTARTPGVDAIASRGCLWRNGRRYCPPYNGASAYGYRSRSTDYYPHQADTLPFGTKRWRDQMRRENRLGNPGG
jgi:hypothetical protein